jgi:hypothetical protein
VRVRVRIEQVPQQRGHDGGEGRRQGEDMWDKAVKIGDVWKG